MVQLKLNRLNDHVWTNDVCNASLPTAIQDIAFNADAVHSNFMLDILIILNSHSRLLWKTVHVQRLYARFLECERVV